MAAFQGYNPYGGYGIPQQIPQMYQQQTYIPQQMMQQPTQQVQQPNVTVRLVTNYNEADAAQIQFDSNTINLFVNMASGEIYVKRFDPNSGCAPIIVYRQEQPKTAQEAPKEQIEYATVEMVKVIEERLNELAEAINAKRLRVVKSDE